MKQRIVSDDFTVIDTQGVRFVEKVDTAYSGMAINYELHVTYKGDKMVFRYKDATIRDAQFARLRAAMDPKSAQP